MSGAPLVLPAWLDRLSDRWWGLSPRLRTILVVLGLTSLLVTSALRTAASPYGPPVPVLVATDDLPAGTVLDTDAVRRARWPADLAPAGHVLEPRGRLTAPLPAGAVLTEVHVTDAGLGGLVDAGRSAVALPAELVPDLTVGTVVAVVATGLDGDGAVLTDHGEVIAADGTSLWLAVPEAAAADVAAAGLRGAVGLAVRASGDDPDP